MTSLAIVLFLAGVLTILLPCILPLLPIVVGVSISDTHRLRPLGTVLGMVVSFVAFTFLLQVVLHQFVELADVLRLGTFQVLFLFGVGFAVHRRSWQLVLGLLSGFFFLGKGWAGIAGAAAFGVVAMYLGGYAASRIQQWGANLQERTRNSFGGSSFLSAFLIGLTLGLVWVPCAGPALGFALTLVRERPGIEAFVLLTSYALGTALPLLIVGYGGQWAVRSVRALTPYGGILKTVAGILLVLTAILLRTGWLERMQTWLVQNTTYGTLGTQLEERIFPDFDAPMPTTLLMGLPTLEKISRAPELSGLGPWHNSEPLTMAGLKGKVVLVDFWTYSCINCIRTLPYLRGYWEKYGSATLSSGESAFVLLGVHTPEFAFEKSQKNVADAIERHDLTYPVAQDNDYGTWRAFANRYWPAKYLIDADGYIRYVHFGEGAYDETDKAIASLLTEAGVRLEGYQPLEGEASRRVQPRSAETYLGARSWPVFGNAQGEPSPEAVEYAIPQATEPQKYYLGGTWRLVENEHQVLESQEGEIRMTFQGSEANLVLGLEEGVQGVEAEVWIDGEKSADLIVDRYDLYNLFQGDYGQHELSLRFKRRGVQGYAFTFGS